MTRTLSAPTERPRMAPAKFRDPERTADGSLRAHVAFSRLDTLWINTGTLCNIECANCYIESSPSNDRLAYMTREEVRGYLDEVRHLELPTGEIGFTGGEPFMNPDILGMLKDALEAGFSVFVLTNAMLPMQRPGVRRGLLELRERHGEQLSLRVSLDHYHETLHDEERGHASWKAAVRGLDWLVAHGFRVSVAGRSLWGEVESQARLGYENLFARRAWPIDARDPAALVIFPEMDERVDVPEITVDCWSILGVDPEEMMCATSRMIVKRRGSEAPVVLPCTLLPYDEQFELGETLAGATGSVHLNHPHCAKFCVLGGGSCSPT